MALIKLKNQVELSFHNWLHQHPESMHPLDMKRFYVFVKCVCVYNAKKWKDSNFLKEKILELKPNFDPDLLERLLNLYENLIEFYRISALPRCWYIDDQVDAHDGYYIERGIKNGSIYQIEKPQRNG